MTRRRNVEKEENAVTSSEMGIDSRTGCGTLDRAVSVAGHQGSNKGASKERRGSHRERCGASRKQRERRKVSKSTGYTRIKAGADDRIYFGGDVGSYSTAAAIIHGGLSATRYAANQPSNGMAKMRV